MRREVACVRACEWMAAAGESPVRAVTAHGIKLESVSPALASVKPETRLLSAEKLQAPMMGESPLRIMSSNALGVS